MPLLEQPTPTAASCHYRDIYNPSTVSATDCSLCAYLHSKLNHSPDMKGPQSCLCWAWKVVVEHLPTKEIASYEKKKKKKKKTSQQLRLGCLVGAREILLLTGAGIQSPWSLTLSAFATEDFTQQQPECHIQPQLRPWLVTLQPPRRKSSKQSPPASPRWHMLSNAGLFPC